MKRIDPAGLVKELIGIPSVSGDEAAAAEAVLAWTGDRGLRAAMEGRNVVIRAGRPGCGRILLASHLDTVPPAAGWRTDPFRPVEEEGRIIGLGANDAKGCVAAMLCAAAHLAAADPEGEVVLALTVEEETGVSGEGLESLIGRLGALDAAVIGEPTGLAVCTSQKGLLILEVETTGDARHAAHAHRIPGGNAVTEAARAILALEGWFPAAAAGSRGPATCQVTAVAGGTGLNVIPGRCRFTLDIRTVPGLSTEWIVRETARRTGGRVTVRSDRLKPFETGESAAIVRAALRARPGASLVASDTMSDAAWTRHLPTIKAGPGMTERSHRPGEFVTRDELAAGTAFYTRLVREFFALAREKAS